ncbi:MAG: transporter related protein [Acidimicrobiales bacterium]|nr:transporter related protein [Acidimicrobiales bacterium]
MATLQARDLTLSFGPDPVLDAISLTVAPGHRLGVVGPNGTGKSTLLRVLAGLAVPDAGRVSTTPPTATVGLLPQEPDRRTDESVLAFLERRTGVAAASAALDDATAGLAAGRAGADDEYSDALDRWLTLGGADVEARAGSTLADLGLGADLLARPTAALSGGQAARVSLAATLLARFDVFLLDEPTNDLDFDGLARLEDFVCGLDAAVVVVSHDRAFLERVVTDVLELDEHHHTGTWFGGGWTAYLDAKATARRHAEEAYGAYRDKRQALTDRARTQRDWAVQGVRKAQRDTSEKDKFIKQFKVNSSEHVAAKAKITDRALARLEAVDKPWEGWDLHLEIGNAERSGDVVARLRDAVVERGDFRLGPIDLEIGWAERVAIVGPNGAGKTTLLDAILGRLDLTAGERWLGSSVVVGELDQRRSSFATERTVLDVVVAESGLLAQEVRSLLAKFGLAADHVARPARSLSPGERTRAGLALFMARGVNCLVLDEPTNHLDLPAIEQLEQALDTFAGTVLLVTHDRRLLDDVRIDRRLEVQAGQLVLA